MFKRILVAVDGSPTAHRGLRTAIDLAADQQARLYVLHVVDDMAAMPPANDGFIAGDLVDGMIGALRDSGRAILAKATALACDRGVDAPSLLVESLGRSVAATILREARKQKVDLIVLGTHGRRGLRRVLLGSDAEAVLRESRVPVLLVRSPERATRRSAHATSKEAGAAARRARGTQPPRVATDPARR